MAETTRYWAVVPAAGIGRRMGSDVPKQFLKLGDRTVLEHSLDALFGIAGLAGLVLVTADGTLAEAIRSRYEPRGLRLAAGGRERCHSVLNGLLALADGAGDEDWVLVHDAARPCVRAGDLKCLVASAQTSECGGLLGLPVRDTMKRADAGGRVDATLDREGMWHAFTPQMFRYAPLKAALEDALQNGFEVTDEASAMEHAGCRPQLVEGHADNIKITRAEDLPLAAFFLSQQGRL